MNYKINFARGNEKKVGKMLIIKWSVDFSLRKVGSSLSPAAFGAMEKERV